MDKKYSSKLIESGSVKIGTLWEYKTYESDPRADVAEGRSTIVFDGVVDSGMPEIVPFMKLGGVSGNFVSSGNTILAPTHPDLYI